MTVKKRYYPKHQYTDCPRELKPFVLFSDFACRVRLRAESRILHGLKYDKDLNAAFPAGLSDVKKRFRAWKNSEDEKKAEL